MPVIQTRIVTLEPQIMCEFEIYLHIKWFVFELASRHNVAEFKEWVRSVCILILDQ